MKLFWLLFSPLLLFGAVNDAGDFQLWNNDSFQITANDKLDFRIDIEFRFGNNASTLWYTHLQGGVIAHFNQYVSLGPTNRQTWSKVRGTFEPFYIPGADLFLSYTSVSNWELTNRSRFQYIIPDTSKFPNRLRYRNRILVVAPWKFSIFRPFTSNELFFLEGRGFNQNRFSIGILAPSMSLYYRLRTVRIAKWVNNQRFPLKVIQDIVYASRLITGEFEGYAHPWITPLHFKI